MSAVKNKVVGKQLLQNLVPFNALSPGHFSEVLNKTRIQSVPAGFSLFREGDEDSSSIYVLDGEINLLAGKEVVGTVRGGTEAARHPIAHQQPRQVTARARTPAVIARIDSSLLDIMLTWDQSAGYEVEEIDDGTGGDWMTRMLRSHAFLKLPPSNIQRLLNSVESVSVQAGDVVVEQGEEGDYFYIIRQGRCAVTRRASRDGKEIRLAELADGDAFGEDALVSDARRNATVTMLTDGILMRLSKKDFVELLKEPLISTVDYPEAAAMADRGAEWLDVRLPGEYENSAIRGSRNIPLAALRTEMDKLDPAVSYIVCCDTGRRSASAAFLLSQRGYEVHLLRDGLSVVPPVAMTGSVVVPPAAAAAAEEKAVAPLAPPAEPPVAEAADRGPKGSRELQAEIERLQEELAAGESRIAELQAALDEVREDARTRTLELEQALKAERATRQQLERKLEEAEALVEEISNEADEAREAYARRCAALEERLQDAADAEAEVAAELRDSLARLEQERDALRRELDEQRLEAELLSEQLAQAQAAAETAAMAAGQDALPSDVDLVREALAREQAARQQEQLEVAETMARLREDLAAARAECRSMDEESGALRLQLEALRAEAAEQKQALEMALRQTRDEAQSELNLAHDEISRLAREIDEMRVAHERERREQAVKARHELQTARDLLARREREFNAELQRLRLELEQARREAAADVDPDDVLRLQEELATLRRQLELAST